MNKKIHFINWKPLDSIMDDNLTIQAKIELVTQAIKEIKETEQKLGLDMAEEELRELQHRQQHDFL